MYCRTLITRISTVPAQCARGNQVKILECMGTINEISKTLFINPDDKVTKHIPDIDLFKSFVQVLVNSMKFSADELELAVHSLPTPLDSLLMERL